MDSIAPLLQSGAELDVVLARCEEVELEAAREPAKFPPTSRVDTVSTVQLALYLIQGDLNSARFLYKRLPPSVREKEVEIDALWRLGTVLWLRQDADIFTLEPEVRQGLPSSQWSEHIAPLVTRILQAVRERSLDVISRAYTNIQLADIARRTGMTTNDAATLVQSMGWQIGGDGQVTPQPKTTQDVDFSILDSIDMSHLQTLTEHVVALER
eukprot:TRINITY_DN6430_c0_g1_i1.p1 TRINITY_DN6430_c0_g1~~TRINITY_DN6430_c0_g1_i1.p1  ORF type:complete len:212 (+),score=9.88 TRINITY_DN6430_c0_g1_i1:202-837(+)